MAKDLISRDHVMKLHETPKQGLENFWLVNTWRSSGVVCPKEDLEAPCLSAPCIGLSIPSIWLFLSCISYNKTVIVSKVIFLHCVRELF